LVQVQPISEKMILRYCQKATIQYIVWVNILICNCIHFPPSLAITLQSNVSLTKNVFKVGQY
jgi:hypothetical protein